MNRSEIRFGVQSFGLKKELTEDLEGTLKAAKAAGYDVFEPLLTLEETQMNPLKGFVAKDTFREIVKICKEIGMTIESAHAAVGLNDAPEDVVALLKNAHEMTGATRFVIGGMCNTKAEAIAWAEYLNKILNAGLRDFGKLLYHNHGHEFHVIPEEEREGDEYYVMDAIIARVPEMMLEPDFGWAWFGGAVYEDMKKYYDKIELIHLKDFYPPVQPGAFEPTVPECFSPIGEGLAWLEEPLQDIDLMPNFAGLIVPDQDFDEQIGMIEAGKISLKNVKKVLGI